MSSSIVKVPYMAVFNEMTRTMFAVSVYASVSQLECEACFVFPS